ncbi:DUF1722 domain-containing protein [Staphylococcus caprae]|uniref:DUF1722 domain-containing protein n=1 Tax=Staphylococcus caprae TaxID=29380 RepID=UPI003B20C22E
MKERGKIEKLWREEKYHVLLHHQHACDNIRDMLKGDPSLIEVQNEIENALAITPTKGSIINAYDHMWGYFKKVATDEEQHKALLLKNKFNDNQLNQLTLLNYLKELADKYEVRYLQNSTVLKQLK